MINRALAPYPDDLVITTKVGPSHDGLARPDQLRGQVEENLRQLGRDYLDVVNLRQHGLDSIAEHFGALAELCDAGLIRHLGISNVRPQHLAQAQAIAPVVCVQNRYGVDFGRGHEQLRTCGEQGIAFVSFFALAGTGREAGGCHRQRRGTRHRPRAWGDARAGPSGLDTQPRPTRARHPGHRQPGSPG